MGRKYWVDIPPTDVSASIDLLEIVPVAGAPVKVVSLQLGQTSDFGDAAAENLLLVWVRGHTVPGSGGTVITPTPNASPGRAATFTAKVFNTVIASGGSPVNGPRHCFNIAGGVDRPFLLEEAFEASSVNGTLVLRIIDANSGTAPLDALTIHGSVLVEEAN
jgi:hypothetical protein